jgi:hypothetical protein
MNKEKIRKKYFRETPSNYKTFGQNFLIKYLQQLCEVKACGGGTLLQLSPRHPKVKGLSPTISAETIILHWVPSVGS